MARMIDADALRDDLRARADAYKAKKDWAGYSAVSNIIVTLDNTPAVDAVPVTHGHWLDADDGDGKVCSACGEDYCDMVMGCNVHEWKYCPNCGAKMDGEKETEDEQQ